MSAKAAAPARTIVSSEKCGSGQGDGASPGGGRTRTPAGSGWPRSGPRRWPARAPREGTDLGGRDAAARWVEEIHPRRDRLEAPRPHAAPLGAPCQGSPIQSHSGSPIGSQWSDVARLHGGWLGWSTRALLGRTRSATVSARSGSGMGPRRRRASGRLQDRGSCAAGQPGGRGRRSATSGRTRSSWARTCSSSPWSVTSRPGSRSGWAGSASARPWTASSPRRWPAGWARRFLTTWLRALRWQRLPAFQKLGRLLTRHLVGILNSCHEKVPFGIVERSTGTSERCCAAGAATGITSRRVSVSGCDWVHRGDAPTVAPRSPRG